MKNVLKAIFAVCLIVVTQLAIHDHLRMVELDKANHLISGVLKHADHDTLRPYCVDLVVGDALVLRPGPRANKAKIICQEELGL